MSCMPIRMLLLVLLGACGGCDLDVLVDDVERAHDEYLVYEDCWECRETVIIEEEIIVEEEVIVEETYYDVWSDPWWFYDDGYYEDPYYDEYYYDDYYYDDGGYWYDDPYYDEYWYEDEYYDEWYYDDWWDDEYW